MEGERHVKAAGVSGCLRTQAARRNSRGLNSKSWTGAAEVGFPLGEDPEDRRQGWQLGLGTKPHLLIDL